MKNKILKIIGFILFGQFALLLLGLLGMVLIECGRIAPEVLVVLIAVTSGIIGLVILEYVYNQ